MNESDVKSDTTPGYKVYEEYIALKNHFSSESYDYFKYNGRSSVSFDTFKRRKERWYFEKLFKTHTDYSIFLLANIANNKNFWIGNYKDENVKKCYQEWIKYTQNPEYHFEQDLNILKSLCESKQLGFNDLMNVRDGKHPVLHLAYKSGIVKLQTVAIFESIFQFTSHADVSLSGDIIWKDESFFLKKLSPFFYPKKEFKNLIRKVFSDT